MVSAAAVEVIAGTLGLGDAASEAVGLGREDEAAARGAVPVSRPAGRGGALAEAATNAPSGKTGTDVVEEEKELVVV